MSEIRANTITDAAGTGAPNFPNGLSGSGASLTSLPAGQLTGALPAISGASLTNLPAPTSAQVGTATAGLSAGGVGTYAFLSDLTNTTISAGTTRASSNLYYAGVGVTSSANTNAYSAGQSGQPSGTWMVMGYAASNGNTGRNNTTLWLRIS